MGHGDETMVADSGTSPASPLTSDMTTPNPSRRGKRRRTSPNRRESARPHADDVQVATDTMPIDVALQQTQGRRSLGQSPAVTHTASSSGRAPNTPFYPDALPFWVLEDDDGNKSLVEEMVPGCRHWRIGDPHVDSCFECNEHEDNGLLECHTCKRAYHQACLGVPLSTLVSNKLFHCPTCTQRGWNDHPPQDLLPLVPCEPVQDVPEPEYLMDDQSLRHESMNPERTPESPIVATSGAGPPQPADRQTRSLKRRSRYQTVPDEVDQAMVTIYRHLEYATELKTGMENMQSRVAALEQERRMQEGQFALAREDLVKQARAENESLRQELANVKSQYDELQRENRCLKAELQQAKSVAEAKTQEMDAMKANLRQWLEK